MNSPDSFKGFPAETFRFLAELEQNNDREWFNAKRDTVEQAVIAPAQVFVAAFGERARRIYPELVYDARTNGAGSMFRMNRDTRFSNDKSPYKTNLGFRFWLSPAERAAKRVRLYVHLDKNGVRVYGGEHCQMQPAALAILREAIARDAKGELKRVLERLSKNGFTSDNEQLVRVPHGYPPDHPSADLLRRKSLFMLSPLITPNAAGTRAVIEQCAAHAEALKPLSDWLTSKMSQQAAD